MIIQELLKKIVDENEEDFIKYYIRYDENLSEKNIDTLKMLFKSLISCKPNKNKENFIIFSVPDIGELSADSFLIKSEDLGNKNFEHYAYEFDKMKTILGYQVSQACIRYLGEFRYLSSILYEMTFFGYNMESQNRRTNKEKKELNESIEEVKKEGFKGISLDELREHLGFKDERKSFEKRFDLNELKIEGNFQRNILKELIKLEIEYGKVKR